MISAVILAGGSGERFWPKSRVHYPKQFITFFDNQSLFEHTYNRISKIVPDTNIFVSTNSILANKVKEYLPQIPNENIIIEPYKRDTAAAIGLAAITIQQRATGDVIVVLPSDHFIGEPEKFLDDIVNSANIALKTGCLITFGINPSRPETGYGYINCGEEIIREKDTVAYEVKQFIEKPSLEKAIFFLKEKKYLWNSGMFVFTVNSIFEAIELYLPELHSGLLEIQQENFNFDTIKKVFENLKSISIDYGIMEKAKNVLCILASFKWDDIGCWTALERWMDKDKNNNILYGKSVLIDTKNCIINSENQLVTALGVEGLIIIATGDVILVCKKEREQEIKKLLKEMATIDDYKKFL